MDKCGLCGGDSGGYVYCASCDAWKSNEDPKRVSPADCGECRRDNDR